MVVGICCPVGAPAAVREAEGGWALSHVARVGEAPSRLGLGGPAHWPDLNLELAPNEVGPDNPVGGCVSVFSVFFSRAAECHGSRPEAHLGLPPVAVARVCESLGCSQLRARPWAGATQWPSRGTQRPHMICLVWLGIPT